MVIPCKGPFDQPPYWSDIPEGTTSEHVGPASVFCLPLPLVPGKLVVCLCVCVFVCLCVCLCVCVCSVLRESFLGQDGSQGSFLKGRSPSQLWVCPWVGKRHQLENPFCTNRRRASPAKRRRIGEKRRARAAVSRCAQSFVTHVAVCGRLKWGLLIVVVGKH